MLGLGREVHDAAADHGLVDRTTDGRELEILELKIGERLAETRLRAERGGVYV